MKDLLIVFDLDFTLWNCGDTYCDHTRPPYSERNGRIYDSAGFEMRLYPETIILLQELARLEIPIAIASRTGASDQAKELLDLFGIGHYFTGIEMYPGSKIPHFRSLREKTGIAFNSMHFFDDEYRNIEDARSLGVNAYYVEDGILFEDVMSILPENAYILNKD